MASIDADSVQIVPVRGFGDLRRFIALPYRLHAGTPWIPPLKLERYAFLIRRLNAFFTHGEAEYFLAVRGGRVVGRVTAQVDRSFNAFHDNRWGMFGFLEFEDDQEIARRAARYRRGVAPRARLRADGRADGLPAQRRERRADRGLRARPGDPAAVAPALLPARVEAAGLTKAMDLFSWWLDVADRDKVLPILPEVAERARTTYGITIRKMSRRHLRRTWTSSPRSTTPPGRTNWGFVPYSEHDLNDLALTYQLVYDRDWFMVAEIEGETVAMAITVPDVNQVLKKMKGRLLPFGWWHYLRRNRYIDGVRVGFLGVLPEHQHTGAAALLYMEHYDMAAKPPQKWGEAHWILETNKPMNRGLEAMGGEIVKRYRVYERLLEP